MMNDIKVLLVDDHSVVRAGYRFLLENAGGILIAEEVAGGEEAHAAYQRCAPDVVVMDLSMPGMSGLEAIHQLRGRDPQARILVFSVHEEVAFVHRALEAGAIGYITKRSAPEVLVKAVRQVARGKLYVDEELLPYVIGSRRRSQSAGAFDKLTDRELEICMLLARGKSARETAETLHLSPKTVANYTTAIKEKLEVASLPELIHLALRHGLGED